MTEENWPDRKAHASLAQIEDRLLEGLRQTDPSLTDSDGGCTHCVALEHALADEYHAQATVSELTDA